MADILDIETDVVVIGGGMAALWAAVASARSGAATVLVDKGFAGTSGVTAAGGPGHWWVPPDPAAREEAVERRHARSFGLADRGWMAASIDTTWRALPELVGFYPFGDEQPGRAALRSLRGPEYIRALRRMAEGLGVRILDHSPALGLLLHRDGSVAGVQGVQRISRPGRVSGRDWRARSGAVVLATGGCAWLSGLIGSATNTGDGYLMAAEAGARLSGMEFSVSYSVSPAWHSTRVLLFAFARYFDAHGRELNLPPMLSGGDFIGALAAELARGPVLAQLDRMPPEVRAAVPQVQPASLLPFRRRGIDPFNDRFEVALFGEGTIRGTGGLRIADAACRTDVAGLYAAGDAATRELIAGATSGGGAQNSAWAVTSGLRAGAGAADRARRTGRRTRDPVRPAACETTPVRDGASAAEVVRLVQHHMLPTGLNLIRSPASLRAARDGFDSAQEGLAAPSGPDPHARIAAREARSLLATARWATHAALARTETRGMHRRADAPATDPAQARRLLVWGTRSIGSAFDGSTPDAGRARDLEAVA